MVPSSEAIIYLNRILTMIALTDRDLQAPGLVHFWLKSSVGWCAPVWPILMCVAYTSMISGTVTPTLYFLNLKTITQVWFTRIPSCHFQWETRNTNPSMIIVEISIIPWSKSIFLGWNGHLVLVWASGLCRNGHLRTLRAKQGWQRLKSWKMRGILWSQPSDFSINKN